MERALMEEFTVGWINFFSFSADPINIFISLLSQPDSYSFYDALNRKPSLAHPTLPPFSSIAVEHIKYAFRRRRRFSQRRLLPRFFVIPITRFLYIQPYLPYRNASRRRDVAPKTQSKLQAPPLGARCWSWGVFQAPPGRSPACNLVLRNPRVGGKG